MENMSKILIELRKEKSMSQKELADQTGISQSTIAKIEIGRNEATSNTIRKLSDFFNVTSDYLLGRTDELGTVLPSASIPVLTDREAHVLNLFRKMSFAEQNRYIGFGEGLLGNTETSKSTKRRI